MQQELQVTETERPWKMKMHIGDEVSIFCAGQDDSDEAMQYGFLKQSQRWG